MKLLPAAFLASVFITQFASAAIIERRIWIEDAMGDIREQMCDDKMKAWRCLFERDNCLKVMKEAYNECAPNVLADLPEYIDSKETKEQAQKIVKDCMTTAIAKKYIVPLPKDKMDEYNICTGVMARQKPLSQNLQKALDYSKTLTASHCANGSFYRKCWGLAEKECTDKLAKHHLDCTMKMEADGISVKPDEGSIQETGRKITECALGDLRKDLDSTKKKVSKDKDCE